MKKEGIIFFLSILLVFYFFGCHKEKEKIENPFPGKWTIMEYGLLEGVEYEDLELPQKYVFKYLKDNSKKEFLFEFKEDGKFVINELYKGRYKILKQNRVKLLMEDVGGVVLDLKKENEKLIFKLDNIFITIKKIENKK